MFVLNFLSLQNRRDLNVFCFKNGGRKRFGMRNTNSSRNWCHLLTHLKSSVIRDIWSQLSLDYNVSIWSFKQWQDHSYYSISYRCTKIYCFSQFFNLIVILEIISRPLKLDVEQSIVRTMRTICSAFMYK